MHPAKDLVFRKKHVSSPVLFAHKAHHAAQHIVRQGIHVDIGTESDTRGA